MSSSSSSRFKSHGKWLLLLLIVAALLALLLAWMTSWKAFFYGYLAAALLSWSVSIGSLTFMYIFGLTAGKWGRAAWPWLAINARLMPLCGLIFLPVLLGLHELYVWADPGYLSSFEHTEHRQWFYGIPFYCGRTVFYFVLWSTMAWWISRRNVTRLIVRGDAAPWPIHQGIAGLGLVAILLSVTWAGIDWVMSFDPFFGSTLFGALIGMGALMAGMSATVAAICFWTPGANTDPEVLPRDDEKVLGDLSSLLLAMLMLWAYFSFSQWLIMWSEDLPREAAFYVQRNQGVWGWVTPLTSLLGFVVPFLCLLSSRFKRTPSRVGPLAVFLLVIRQIELCWMVLPAAEGTSGFGLFGITALSILFASGLYLAGILWQLDRNDARVREEAAHVT